MELISVIMSVYNETQEMLRQSLESILQQTHQNLEFIIVLDNPSNASAREVLHEYARQDGRIKVLENKENLGLALSLNRALEVVKAQYVARMDADDVSEPSRLERELESIGLGGYDVVFTGVTEVDEAGCVLRQSPAYVEDADFVAQVLPYCCVVCHPTVLMKTEAVRAVGGYRNFYAAQDYDLWLRMILSGYRIGYLREPLLRYRVRTSSVTGRRGLMQFESTRYIRRLYRQRVKGKTDLKGQAYLKTKADSYSWEGYNLYLKEKGADSEKLNKRYAMARGKFSQALELARGGDYKDSVLCALKLLAGLRWKGYSLKMKLAERRVERKYERKYKVK